MDAFKIYTGLDNDLKTAEGTPGAHHATSADPSDDPSWFVFTGQHTRWTSH